jgi:hypothetical protein
MTPLLRRLATVTGTAAALVALLTPAADAGVRKAAPGECSQLSGGSMVFLRNLDFRNYVLAPGGDFENGAPGWTLDNGAQLAARQGNGRTTALALPNRATATSPVFCADATNPTFRMYSSTTSWLPGRVHADLLWIDDRGNAQTTQVGSDFSFPLWRATGSMLLAKVLPLVSGVATPVQLRFTGAGGGALLDDVYIDPARGR